MYKRMYKKSLFFLISSIMFIGYNDNLHASKPSINGIATIVPPSGSQIVMFTALAANGTQASFASPDPTYPNNLRYFCTTTLMNQLGKVIYGKIYNDTTHNGITLGIFTDPAGVNLIGSFTLSFGDTIKLISWNFQDKSGTGPTPGGNVNLIALGLEAPTGNMFAISMGGQFLNGVISSQQKGYQVYDIYMSQKPKQMTVDQLNADLSHYSYTSSSDGPLFMFKTTSCREKTDSNGCDLCDVRKGFMVDGYHVPLPNLPASWYLNSVIIRIHKGLAPVPVVAPNLPSLISQASPPPTMNKKDSSVNLHGAPFEEIALSIDNYTWSFIEPRYESYTCSYNTSHLKLGTYFNHGHTLETAAGFYFGSGDIGRPVYIKINGWTFKDPIIDRITVNTRSIFYVS